VVGRIGTNPMGKGLDLERQVNPVIKTVGLIYKPGEPNFEYEPKVLNEEAAKRNITVVEQSVANSGEVLADKELYAFVKIGDYATIQEQAARLPRHDRLGLH
jgi:putative tryptophan/tyrosine transport system substrate-binding protein